MTTSPMKSERLETRLGPLAWRSTGQGPTLVFFAGVVANEDLWRDVIARLEDRYRCVTIDLPLGAHPWPMTPGADRSATSLARLLLDCLERSTSKMHRGRQRHGRRAAVVVAGERSSGARASRPSGADQLREL